ncbi:MAG: RNA polymerase sporulation sigma factor SigE [Eubacteriales bacterium]
MIIRRSLLLAVSTLRSLIGRVMSAYLAAEGNDSFYVNGADVLPPPLSAREEAEAISRLTEDEEAVSLLVEHNLRLVVYIARKFENTGVGIEDLISIGTIGLIKSVRTYRSDKNIKLATYASRCIENEILMYIRKNSALRGELSIDEPLNIDWDGNELLLSDVIGTDEDLVGRGLEKNEEERTIREAVAELDPRERRIIELRYGLGGGPERTQKDVADMLGISQSYISRLEKKIIRRLREKIETKI